MGWAQMGTALLSAKTTKRLRGSQRRSYADSSAVPPVPTLPRARGHPYLPAGRPGPGVGSARSRSLCVLPLPARPRLNIAGREEQREEPRGTGRHGSARLLGIWHGSARLGSAPRDLARLGRERGRIRS